MVNTQIHPSEVSVMLQVVVHTSSWLHVHSYWCTAIPVWGIHIIWTWQGSHLSLAHNDISLPYGSVLISLQIEIPLAIYKFHFWTKQNENL